MTISNKLRKLTVQGNGSATTFNFPFKINDKADFYLIFTNAAGKDTDLVVDSDYSISGVGNDTGVIVTYPKNSEAAKLATGEKLTGYRTTPIEQLKDFSYSGGFSPKVHENSFDKLTAILLEHNEELSRRPVFPITADGETYDIETWTTNIETGTKKAQDDAFAARFAAEGAQTAAKGAQTAAASAATAATNADNAANTANINASNAVNIASAARNTAISAAESAAQAVTTANTANSTAATASSNASTAVVTANSAFDKASEALSTANGIDAKATQALTDSATALSIAQSAASDASTALSTANDADSKSDQAITDSAAAVSTTAQYATQIANAASSAAEASEAAQLAATTAAEAMDAVENSGHSHLNKDALDAISYNSTTRSFAVGGVELATASDLSAHTSSTNNPHAVTATQVGLGNVNNTSDLSKPISTATQTALDSKANATHYHTKSVVTTLSGVTGNYIGEQILRISGVADDPEDDMYFWDGSDWYKEGV